MAGINKVILIGNLGKDPEVRYTQAGSPIAHFSIATSEKWKDKQSGQQQEKTEWHNITAFGRLAEISGEYLRIGSKVYIEGKLATSSWEKDGQKHYKTEIHMREMQMLDSKEGAPRERSEPQGGPNLPQDTDFSDDIPFSRREL